MVIGVAIPTYSEHIGYLPNLLDQISKSTVLPTQVSISVSSLNGDLVLNDYPFETIITKTSEFKNSAQNRNIAGSKLKTDIITFIDGDDIPHEKRHEYLLDCFNQGCDAIVHNYQYTGLSINEFKSDIGKLDLIKDCIDTYGGGAHTVPLSSVITDAKFSNGHISVLKKIFDKYKYDESSWLFKCCEDVEYSGKLILNGHKISLIKNKLSLYRK